MTELIPQGHLRRVRDAIQEEPSGVWVEQQHPTHLPRGSRHRITLVSCTDHLLH